MISKIISGGQTGTDRAALDAAIELGIPQGGWCPRGRRAEDGRIPDRYQLVETPRADYLQRTEWNVRDSVGTLILVRRLPLEGGTKRTAAIAYTTPRGCMVALLGDTLDHARAWLGSFPAGAAINIAGPRESKCPGIHAAAKAFLLEVLRPGKLGA